MTRSATAPVPPSGPVRYTIRPGRRSDLADLAQLQASVQLQAATGGRPHPGIAAWVEDLLDGHPTVAPHDFLVAEDPVTGRPAASLVALAQHWNLGGVGLPVVQIELVGTAPEHRGNRLTEQLFAALQRRLPPDDAPIQMIEGLPYFYRRLGYDYALANDGAPTVPAAALPPAVPDRPHGTPDDLTVRPATPADADALADIDRRPADRDTLVCPRDAVAWRHEIDGCRPDSVARREVAVLARGSDVRGYLVHGGRLSAAGELLVVAAACRQPADWPRAAAAMYAHLADTGRRYGTTADRPFTALRPILDPAHPLVGFGPAGVPRRPRGWYVRADPIALLARLHPVLRARWTAAGMRWPEPTMTVDTYGPAARLGFSDGELTEVTAVRGDAYTGSTAHVTVPPGALLHLVLGHRTLPEVLDAWPDVQVRDRTTEWFLTAAFPRVPVRVWPRT